MGGSSVSVGENQRPRQPSGAEAASLVPPVGPRSSPTGRSSGSGSWPAGPRRGPPPAGSPPPERLQAGAAQGHGRRLTGGLSLARWRHKELPAPVALGPSISGSAPGPGPPLLCRE